MELESTFFVEQNVYIDVVNETKGFFFQNDYHSKVLIDHKDLSGYKINRTVYTE